MKRSETLHILGICGTFMGGIAALAQALGYRVSGSDRNVYPPMSTQLESLGVELMEGYVAAHLNPHPDHVVIGNAGIARGNPELEAVLDRGFDYASGAEWLGRHVLRDRWVLAVAGTHGKTTTASMLAWILEYAGLEPGFLIGGVPKNFDVSARLGGGSFFVVEADEYDTSYFDRRSKFIHYRPRTLILNNLEYDHADIFPDLNAIESQFHQLIRTVPSNGLLIANAPDTAIRATLKRGCWTPVESFDDHDGWQATAIAIDNSAFDVTLEGKRVGHVQWQQFGRHNIANALAAIAAARHAGVRPEDACTALCAFKGVKRRMEVRGEVGGITVYDDFAHHPTAIAKTVSGLRQRVGKQRIFAILEPASHTMRCGVLRDALAPALDSADLVYCFQPARLDWEPTTTLPDAHVHTSIDTLIDAINEKARQGDHLLVMSNGGFDNVHAKLLATLRANHD